MRQMVGEPPVTLNWHSVILGARGNLVTPERWPAREQNDVL
jgi:hypothetical protein